MLTTRSLSRIRLFEQVESPRRDGDDVRPANNSVGVEGVVLEYQSGGLRLSELEYQMQHKEICRR